MTVTNAELNILATGYVTKQSEDSKDDSSVSAGNDSDNDTEVDDYVDYEVLSESVDKTKPFMQTGSEYDGTGNYVTSETNDMIHQAILHLLKTVILKTHIHTAV